MTVSTAYTPLSYAGNDATTAFAVTWPFFSGSLVVTLVDSSGVETVQTLTTHYTVSGGTDANGRPSTGTVTMLTAPAAGTTLRITRRTELTQAATWAENDAFPQATVESALDKLTLLAQESYQPGTTYDGISGDVLELDSSGATNYWDAESHIIRNVATPTEASDAVTKSYVDERVSDFESASISVGTVTTGEPGSSASVSISGTYPTYTLNFTIPRGDTGASGSGTGDVVGPSSATDNAIVRFDGTTGKIVQTSAITVSDTTGSLVPTATGTAWLGSATLAFAGAHIASGGEINFAAGGVRIVHSGDALAFEGGSSGYYFDSDLKPNASDAYGLGTAINTFRGLYLALGRPIDWGASNTVLVGSGGDLTVNGVTLRKAGKETIFVPASAMVSRTTNGAASGTTELATNKVMLATKDFDATTEEGVGFFVAMPKSWNESTVTFRPFWTAASGSGGVVWGLAAYALSDDDPIDVAVSGQQTSADTLITANDMHIGPESAAITIGGTPAEGDVVYFELTREVSDASDTLAADAKLIGLHIYITTNASTDA